LEVQAVASALIDVWDAKTFDQDLAAILAEAADLIRNYLTTENQNFLSHDLGREPAGTIIRPENPHTARFLALKEAIGDQMQSRTIRAWHYTRLTESEVKGLRRDGAHLSTPATLRARLDALVASGQISTQQADALYAGSPFHSDQPESRSDKFWLVSHPQAIDDGGVEPFMARWGGEVASMGMKDPALLALIAVTGKPRVVEVAVPLVVTSNGYEAAGAVVATFGRALGCIPSAHGFDLWVTAPLGPDAIIRVHTEGEAFFHAMGRGYPESYVNVDRDYWKELTGED
jgi:hypothetical protein